MATQLDVIVAGVTTSLSDDTTYFHLANDGFGLPPVTRLEEQGPLQDGSTDLGFRYEPRPIQLVLGIRTSDENAYYQKRREITNIFKPRNDPLTLQFTDSNGTVYQINAHYVSNLTLPSADKNAFGPYTHKVGISLKANDPLWFNPLQQVYTFNIATTSGSAFQFPLSFPVSFGGSTLNQTQVITYAGNYKTSPTLEMHGPITDLVISNLTTGIVLDFTGTTIADGDYYLIDTRYGSISVVNSSGTNKIDKLVGNSNLSGFVLEADPDAVDGINSIQVTGTNGNQNTALYFRYYEKYTSI